MKTSDSIAAQEERLKQRDATRIAPWKWQLGHSPNPGGQPKDDLAAEIAPAGFENNWEALYKAYIKAALRGNAYVFKEPADRAYGKLKETHQVDVPFRDASSADLAAQIKRLEVQQGYRKPEEEPLTGGSNAKPN